MSEVEKAFKTVKRVGFVPSKLKGLASIDSPLPIGFGQTISQPTTVRMMLTWLDPQLGESVLDIGSGSGWTSALLSKLVGEEGKVYAVEKIPELLAFGESNCQKAGVTNIEFFLAKKPYGLPQNAPYHRILVSAAAQKLPFELLDQLRNDGKLIIPVKHDVLEITKVSPTEHTTTVHPGFVFVPLI